MEPPPARAMCIRWGRAAAFGVLGAFVPVACSSFGTSSDPTPNPPIPNDAAGGAAFDAPNPFAAFEAGSDGALPELPCATTPISERVDFETPHPPTWVFKEKLAKATVDMSLSRSAPASLQSSGTTNADGIQAMLEREIKSAVARVDLRYAVRIDDPVEQRRLHQAFPAEEP
jgi:hypothetical protein